MCRDLIALAQMESSDVRALLASVRAMSERPQGGAELAGKTIALVFLEDSTRTRTSFAIAARRLGADCVTLTGRGSSMSKGETIADTVRTIEAMGVSAIVLRCGADEGAQVAADALDAPLINAGAGAGEHPTQGLLDAYVVAEAHARLESFDLSGLTVAMVGDIDHSRVARSDIAALTKLGARVLCIGPESLCSASLASLGCEVRRDFDEALGEADAVQMLRVQFERHDDESAIGPREAYRAAYALTSERAARMKKQAIVMHPGPMNRGLEIDDDAADGPRSRILRQVAVGVFVRMAVLAWCCSGQQR